MQHLADLMDEGKFDEFRTAYAGANFDMTRHDPWFGLNVQDLFNSAMLNNRQEFVSFLLDKRSASSKKPFSSARRA